MKTIYFLCILVLLSFNFLNAQMFPFILDNSSKMVSVGVSANPHLNSNVDFMYTLNTKHSLISRIGFYSQINIPLFSQNGLDVDIRFGTSALLNFSENFKSIAGLSWNISKTEDLNGKYLHSGFKIDILPGFYSDNWVMAPHGSFHYQPLVYVSHSEIAQSTFNDLYPNNNGVYNSPKDGLFYQNNLIFQFGVGCIYKQSDWFVNMTAGLQHQYNKLGINALPDIGILPFYGGVNFGYSLESIQ